MYQLTLWGNHTHWDPGVGMTTALILCVFYENTNNNDDVLDTWPDSNVPTRFNPGSATRVDSDTPPSCKYCLEAAKVFDEIYEKQNTEYYGKDSEIPF